MTMPGRKRRRGFQFTIILLLTTGIGVHLAFMMVAKGIFFTPLPYPESDRLVSIAGSMAQRPEIQEALRATPAFDRVTYWIPRNKDLVISWGERRQLARGSDASQGFLSLLGAVPAAGRLFVPEEYHGGGKEVVIISHRLWVRLFNGDLGAVGKELQLDGVGHTVVGVLPAGFRFFLTLEQVDCWFPYPKDNDRAGWTIARLKKGVTIEQAGVALQLLAEPLEPRGDSEEYAALHSFSKLTIGPLLEQLVERYREKVPLLFWSSALVFLIACTNAAGLFLVDSLKRRREMAIRRALGARPRAVISLLFLEYFSLFFVSGILAIGLAGWGAKRLLDLVAPVVTRTDVTGLDGTVLAYAFLLTTVAGFLFSFVPVRAALPSDLSRSLREQGERAGNSRGFRRLNGGVVTVQVALTLAMLAGAGLLLRTYVTLYPSSMGLDPSNKVSFRVNLPESRYAGPEQRWRFSETLRRQLEALPSVEEVTMTTFVPFSRFATIARLEVPGAPQESPLRQQAYHRAISPGYFRFMGMRMFRGRPLNAEDNVPEGRAAVINEATARRFWPDSDPLGKTMTVDMFKVPRKYTVVGIVRDVRFDAASLKIPPGVYVPYRHLPRFIPPGFVVKTAQSPSSLSKAFQSEVWAIDSTLAISQVKTIEQFFFKSLQGRLSTLALLGIGAVVALALSLVGVYVMISHMVGRRAHEIGIRMALGARPGDVAALLLRQVALFVGTGIGLGLVVAWGSTRYLKSLLYGVTPTDPLTLGGVAVGLFLAALAACYPPVRRATKVDPVVALRYE